MQSNRPWCCIGKFFTFLVFLLLSGISSQALADGGFYYSVDGTQAVSGGMGAQRALIWQKPEAVEMWVQSSYNGPAQDFAWVLPLPVEPVAIVEGDPGFLDELVTLTTPWIATITTHYSSDEAAAGGSSVDGDPSNVSVILDGSVGLLDYQVITAETSQALAEWLTENGFDLPESSEEVLNDYLEKGFVFFASKMRTASRVLSEPEGLPVVVFEFPADAPTVFPMSFTALSAKKPVKVLLFTASYYGKLIPRKGGSYRWTIPYQAPCTNAEYVSWLNRLWDTQAPAVFVAEFLAGLHGVFRYSRESNNGLWLDRVHDSCYYSSSDSLSSICTMYFESPSSEMLKLFEERYFLGRFLSTISAEKMTDDVELETLETPDFWGESFPYFDGLMLSYGTCSSRIDDDWNCEIGTISCYDSVVTMCTGSTSSFAGRCSAYYDEHCRYWQCACNSYAKHCSSHRAILLCKNKSWALHEICDHRCENEKCVDCVSSDAPFCSGNRTKAYCQNNEWQHSVCGYRYVCRDAECFEACEPENSTRCLPGDETKIMRNRDRCVDGAWRHSLEDECPWDSICDNGECAEFPACGEKHLGEMGCFEGENFNLSLRCSNSSYERMTVYEECGLEACENGYCKYPCKSREEGTTTCVAGSGVMLHKECRDGFWRVLDGCFDSVSVCDIEKGCIEYLCKFGERRCVGDVVEECGPDRLSWVEDETCSADQCVNGRCVSDGLSGNNLAGDVESSVCRQTHVPPATLWLFLALIIGGCWLRRRNDAYPSRF